VVVVAVEVVVAEVETVAAKTNFVKMQVAVQKVKAVAAAAVNQFF
jgi:hypothetical protein